MRKTLKGCDGTNLARCRLGEPQSPVGSERVLDSEVILVVEDSHDLAIILVRTARLGGGGGIVAALGGDGDGRQVDLLRHFDDGV